MNQQGHILHYCQSGIAVLFGDDGSDVQNDKIKICVETAYVNLQKNAATHRKTLIQVNQTISTEAQVVHNVPIVVYIITLVGSAVDTDFIEAQQRLQQFDPRVPTSHTPKRVQ